MSILTYPITDPEAAGIPLEDQIGKCGHWYGEHVPASAEGPAYCEGCYQSLDGGWTDEQLIAHVGVPHEHVFEYDPEQNTPEAIADRGGDPECWPQHVKDHFATEGS